MKQCKYECNYLCCASKKLRYLF